MQQKSHEIFSTKCAEAEAEAEACAEADAEEGSERQARQLLAEAEEALGAHWARRDHHHHHGDQAVSAHTHTHAYINTFLSPFKS